MAAQTAKEALSETRKIVNAHPGMTTGAIVGGVAGAVGVVPGIVIGAAGGAVVDELVKK